MRYIQYIPIDFGICISIEISWAQSLGVQSRQRVSSTRPHEQGTEAEEKRVSGEDDRSVPLRHDDTRHHGNGPPWGGEDVYLPGSGVTRLPGAGRWQGANLTQCHRHRSHLSGRLPCCSSLPVVWLVDASPVSLLPVAVRGPPRPSSPLPVPPVGPSLNPPSCSSVSGPDRL